MRGHMAMNSGSLSVKELKGSGSPDKARLSTGFEGTGWAGWHGAYHWLRAVHD